MSAQVSAVTRKICWARDRGSCVRCKASLLNTDHELHHRKPRQMGGTTERWRNQPANLIYLCGECHRFAESERDLAVIMGWIIQGDEKAESAQIHYQGHWRRLKNDGSIVPPLTV